MTTLNGTDGKDRLTGTADNDLIVAGAGNDIIDGGAGDDTIAAGAGRDYNVRGGLGADVFEFGQGDEIIKILDFELGVDKILLRDGLTFEDLTRKDIVQDGVVTVNYYTPDGDRLILSQLDDPGVSIADFLESSDQPVDGDNNVGNGDGDTGGDGADDTGDDGADDTGGDGADDTGGDDPQSQTYTAVFGNGQSLMYGTAASPVTSTAQNAFMVDWDGLNYDADGPRLADLTTMDSLGLVPYQSGLRGNEAPGLVDGINSVVPGTNVVFGTTAAGGKSILELSTGTLHANALEQIRVMVEEIQAVGTLSDVAFIRWEQGQGDTDTDIEVYKERLLWLLNEYDQAFDDAAGFDVEVNLVITQVRSYSTGKPAQAQFELAQEHENIILANTEAEFQFNNPASSMDFTHLNGQGQYDKGYSAGQTIGELISSDTPTDAVDVASIEIDGLTMIVHFDNVVGSLRVGDFYTHPDADAPSLETFGAGLFNSDGFTSGMPSIVDAEILDADSVMFTLSEELSGPAVFATSREQDDNTHGSWLEDDNGMIPFQYEDISI